MGAAAVMALVAGPVLAADKVFLLTPADPAIAYPKFNIGVSGIYATIEKGLLVTVDSTEPGTPAEGKFQKGDVLLKVNGKPVSEPEPYIALGNALTAAEAGDGKLDFAIKRGDKEETVTLTIPVLGAYSKIWPLDCKKSDEIIRQAAAFVMQPENLKNPGFFGGLFLLSTGDDKYLPAVKELVNRNSPDKAGDHTWNNGYAGILIGEYYLRTGDKDALPRLKAICADSQERQHYGGWNHWGPSPIPGYVQGGLMNPAGVQLLTTLILAKECGVEVDQGTFDRALTFFYRFAGHMAVPYGDHRPEGWLSGNGKNGMLAGAMTLLDGKAYQMAAQTMSLDMADSYRWVGYGHASSFGDHVWRGLGSVNVPQDKQANYRRSMDRMTWYYDLCRRPKGGFGLLNIGAAPEEGGAAIGLSLAYTAPRKTLRITGAPHTRYSQKVQAPEVPWGRPRDIEFLRTDYCEGFGQEELEPHAIYDKLGDAYHAPKETADRAFFVKMMRHYNPTARTMAGLALGKLGATNEVLEALQHQDPRVRRVALEAITQYRIFWGGGTPGFPPAVVSQTYLPSILKILKDPDSSFWEIDGAILALGMAELDDVMANIDIIREYLKHEEWWLRQAAWSALVPLSKDGKRIEPLLPELFDILAKETHVMPRRFFMSFMREILKDGQMDSGVKRKVAGGMMQATRNTAIEPGMLGAIGRNNRMEMLRFFLEQTPDLAPQVLDELEHLMQRPDYNALAKAGMASYSDWSWIRAYIEEGGWGNPGVIKSAEKLGKKQGAPILARCKLIVAKLDEKKKVPGANITGIEKTQASIGKTIEDCEKRMGAE
jgi:hypothetical protein